MTDRVLFSIPLGAGWGFSVTTRKAVPGSLHLGATISTIGEQVGIGLFVGNWIVMATIWVGR